MTEAPLPDQSLDTDLKHLRQVGKLRGFESRLRRKIWAVLLDLEGCQLNENPQLQPHDEEKQVLLDTNRSFVDALPASVTPKSIPALKHELQDLICRVLRRNPWLHYYQGYHDIAQLVLLVMGSSSASVLVLEKLSLIYLRDFMLSTLSPSMSMLRLVHQIIRVVDPDLANLLRDVEPFYAVSALLTWWTHSIKSHSEACRILDFLLSSDPAMVLYTIAATTVLRREEVVECHGDEDLIFVTLNKGLQGLELEKVLSKAVELYDNIHLRQLRYWKQISSHSCLKTFAEHKHFLSHSGMEAGSRDRIKEHFDAQEIELRKEEEKQAAAKSKSASPGTAPLRIGIIAFGIGVLAVGVAWYIR